jgi:hypothetical protein
MPTIDPRRPCYPLDFELLITSRITDPGDIGIFVGRAERPPGTAARARTSKAASAARVTAARSLAARALATPIFALPYLGWVVIQRGTGGKPAVLAHGGLDDHSVGPFIAEAFARVRAKWPGAPVRSIVHTSGLYTGIACPPPPPGPGPRPFTELAARLDDLIHLMTNLPVRRPNDPI